MPTETLSDLSIFNRALERAEANGYAVPEGWTDWRVIIFDHAFARAVFGEAEVSVGAELQAEYERLKRLCRSEEERNEVNLWFSRRRNNQGWRFHLKKLVLAEDRLACLEEFLNHAA